MDSLTDFQYALLKRISPREPEHMSGSVYRNKSKIRILLGDRLLSAMRGKVLADFGCGEGDEAIELARDVAHRVIGIDIRERLLERARQKAATAGVSERCDFVREPNEKVDAIVSLDSFEHFSDPATVLRLMYDSLKPGGFVAASFGPTWYHPFGGHLFSVFPWAHLLFSEAALVRWRSGFRRDGATRFREVEGGLNQMTIARFKKLIRRGPFHAEFLELVPIRRLRLFHNRLTQEFTTSIVRCKLLKPSEM
ncbi:MAG: class I SAM-dependent methyltransferase [Terriglobia bacterium]